MQRKFAIGQTHRASLEIDSATVERFAELSGDRNPIHLDIEEAKAYGFSRQVVHGALLTALLSRVIGMEVPGPGAVWMSQSIEWLAPVFVGDKIEIEATVESISTSVGVLSLGVTATKLKNGEVVMKGSAKVKVAERMTPTSSSTPVTRRVALVTGGSRGIGAAIASRLATDGVVVAVNYRESKDAAERVVREIVSAGGSAQSFAADMGDSASVSDMVHEIIRSHGQLDIIVHSASPRIGQTSVSELSYGELEPFLSVYLSGALAQLAAALPGMTERKFGRIIFMGTSYLFGIPPAGLSAYIVAKHALWGLVRCMATELGPKGITTNMVSPGMTVTDLTDEIPARIKEVEARKSPMRRLATVQDTAELARFLASEASGYINGANLPVTGGPL
jgi:3-oxoacyl-[acyl-carrier protein] reductase